jgi:hypothetical protein
VLRGTVAAEIATGYLQHDPFPTCSWRVTPRRPHQSATKSLLQTSLNKAPATEERYCTWVAASIHVSASSAFCLSSCSMASAPDLLYSEASFGIAFRCEYEKSKLYLTMSKSDPFRRPLRTFFSDAVAVTSVGAAVVATLGLGSAMKHTPTLFFCSVMLSSWFGGMWPGILAGVLSAITLDYYFVPPLYALGIGLEEGVRVIRS